MPGTITVFACELQPVVVEGLRAVLKQGEEFEFVGSTADPLEALSAIAGKRPAVVLIDQGLGWKEVFRLISEIQAVAPQTWPVLWVTDVTEAESLRALRLGARGIVHKTLTPPALLDCLRAAGRGNVCIENSVSGQLLGALNCHMARLTCREREIVRLVARGLKNRQIAEALKIAPGTVKVHLMHIFERTGAQNRFELAMQAQKLLAVGGEEQCGRPAGSGNS